MSADDYEDLIFNAVTNSSQIAATEVKQDELTSDQIDGVLLPKELQPKDQPDQVANFIKEWEKTHP